MNTFTAEEAEALGGLNVDPNMDASTMESLDVGDAGRQSDAHLAAYIEQFGEKVVSKAYARGWRPQEEHRGNPENWLDPIDFYDRYAETSDNRAEKAAERKMAGILEAAEKRIARLEKSQKAINENDFQATVDYYNEKIAGADPRDIARLMKERDQALSDIAVRNNEPEPAQNTAVSPELAELYDAHPWLNMPESAQDHADIAFANARAAELDAKFPGTAPSVIFQRIARELDERRGAKPRATGRMANSGSGQGMAKSTARSRALGPADLTKEQNDAFTELARLGIYQDTSEGKAEYCADLQSSLEG